MVPPSATTKPIHNTGETLPVRSVRYAYDSRGSITRATDVMGNAVTYGYDAGGKLTSITDQEGRIRRVEYGPTNRVSRFIDADGAETDYRYDYDRLKKLFYVRIDHPLTAAGRRVEEQWIDAEGYRVRRDVNGRTVSQLTRHNRQDLRTDDRGQKIQLERDEWDNVTKTVWPDGSTTSARYSPRHLGPIEAVDEKGIRTLTDYDTRGNPIRRTEAAGLPEQRVTEWTYDQFGQVLTETVKGSIVTLPDAASVSTLDATTTFEYDAYGNRITVTDAEGNVTRAVYSRLGQVTETTDARGHRWTASFDARGLLLAQTDPLGHSTSQTFNKAGERTSRTDPTGAVWRYAYDAKGRLVETTDPLRNVARTAYDAAGQITEQTDFAGQVTRRISYDRDGRPKTQTDAVGNAVEFVYGDAASNTGDLPLAVSYPTFVQRITYDARGRPVTVTTEPKAAFNVTASPALVTRTEYDAAGNRTAVTDAAGNVTRYTFDALRRNTAVTDAAGGTTVFAFDSRDNLLAVRDANGNQHRIEVDRLGRKTRETRPNGEAWTWTYDAAGNLATQTDAKGQTTSHSYDSANRLIRTVVGAKTITYDYNPAGSLTAWADGSAGGSITLDELQRKTAETINYGAFSHTYRYRYAAAGTKSALVYPDGTEVQYTHDAMRQLTQIRLPQGAIATTYRNAYTQIETLYPGGTRSTTQLDALLRVASIDVKGPTQQTLLAYGYTFDAAGNITGQQTHRGTNSFGYDKLYRLTQASYGHGLPNDTFTYDKVHNRLTDATQPGTWTYNPNNQLLNQGAGATWSYDANGQAIQKQAGATTRRYVYNPENRLAEVQEAGATLAKYAYDPFGRRIRKEVTQGAQTTTTFYLYADEGLLAEIDGAGHVTTQYGWQPDGLWGTNPVYRLDQAGSANTLLVYHTDHLGTPQQMTNTAGQVVWSQRQKAFGEMVVDTTSTATNQLRFPGQYFDAETGTHYNYHRDYDPVAGRYALQSDPIGLRGGLNIYAYAVRNPVLYMDNLGLEPRGSWKQVTPSVTGWSYAGVTPVDPTFNAHTGSLTFFHVGIRVNGKVRATVQCVDDSELDCNLFLRREWEMSVNVPVSVLAKLPVGVNLYVLGGTLLGVPAPYIWAAIILENLVRGGVAVHDAYSKWNSYAALAVSALYSKSPTEICRSGFPAIPPPPVD